METLENIKASFGNDKKISVARELTKMFEEVKTGSVEEIISYYNENPLKGEIVVMVYADENVDLDSQEIIDKIKILKEEGFSPKDISKIISKLYGENKNKIYKLVLDN
jgi:16S rRNA (cytidine1402-2'-O)-methyltransferase